MDFREGYARACWTGMMKPTRVKIANSGRPAAIQQEGNRMNCSGESNETNETGDFCPAHSDCLIHLTRYAGRLSIARNPSSMANETNEINETVRRCGITTSTGATGKD